ncbi:retrovirus-related pol polyprotein from transposon TNT 1-94 [Tanacetum coccineum]
MVVPNISQVKFTKKEVEDHHRISSISKKTKSVTACNDSSNSRTSNANAVCAECGKCVFNSDHDACVSRYLKALNARTKTLSEVTNNCYNFNPFLVDSGCTKQMTGNLKLLCNLWGENAGKSSCFVKDLQGHDFLTGLPKLKYAKDQLCSSCEMSKAKRSSFKTKAKKKPVQVPKGKAKILLHMDLLKPPEVLKDFLTMINALFKLKLFLVRTVQRARNSEQDTPCFIISKKKAFDIISSNLAVPSRNKKESDYVNYDPVTHDPKCRSYSSEEAREIRHIRKRGIDLKNHLLQLSLGRLIHDFCCPAAHKSFLIYQMDMKMTFLNGPLKEEVYVAQPEGFVDPDNQELRLIMRDALILGKAFSVDKFLGDKLVSWMLKNITALQCLQQRQCTVASIADIETTSWTSDADATPLPAIRVSSNRIFPQSTKTKTPLIESRATRDKSKFSLGHILISTTLLTSSSTQAVIKCLRNRIVIFDEHSDVTGEILYESNVTTGISIGQVYELTGLTVGKRQPQSNSNAQLRRHISRKLRLKTKTSANSDLKLSDNEIVNEQLDKDTRSQDGFSRSQSYEEQAYNKYETKDQEHSKHKTTKQSH